MSSIEVYRGAGDIMGEPIIEPILSADALLVRGRAEMDQHAHPVMSIDVDAVFRAGLRVGQLCALADPSMIGGVRRGKLTGIGLRFDGQQIQCALTVEAQH
jgi:hypothetical protein